MQSEWDELMCRVDSLFGLGAPRLSVKPAAGTKAGGAAKAEKARKDAEAKAKKEAEEKAEKARKDAEAKAEKARRDASED